MVVVGKPDRDTTAADGAAFGVCKDHGTRCISSQPFRDVPRAAK